MSPRWLDVLTEVLLSEGKNPTYTLSTILITPAGPVPRSRSVIHRGIITPSPARPLLLTTTDIRTPKADQLHANPSIEATFWFRGPNAQFRIVAFAHLLPHPAHVWRTAFPARELGHELDWEMERLRAFDGLSGHLRASFVRPVPGTPMGSYEEAAAWPETVPKCGEGEEVEEALENFALVVLDPSEVEFLELGPIPNRRTKWTRRGGEWEEQIVVP